MYRTLVQGALALALLPAAHAGTTYHLVDLGANTSAFGINASGQVAGQQPSGFAGTYANGTWSGPRPRGVSSTAIAIDKDGNTSGSETETGRGDMVAVWYRHGTHRVEVPLPVAAFQAGASALSSNGAYLAGSFTTGSSQACFTWQPRIGGTAVELAPPSAAAICTAMGVNDAGDVAGRYVAGVAPSAGFVYTGGRFVTVGTLPGGTFSWLVGINNLGHAAGFADFGLPNESSAVHPVLWDGNTLVDLDPDSTANTHAAAINGHDDVVANGDESILLFRHGHRLNVTKAIVDDLGTWTIETMLAEGLNDDGVIVGSGLHTDAQGVTARHAFMLVPIKP